MDLSLYYKNTDDQFVEISSNGDLTSPLITVHNGKTGEEQVVALYIRNSHVAKWFSNVIIKPVDHEDADPYGDVIFTETGWGVKLHAGSESPTLGEWEDIDWGDSIDMSNIGSDESADTATYFPFWYLITCPSNTDAKIKTDIVLNVSYTENSVV